MSILIKGIDMPKDCDECPMRQINLAYCQLMHESTSHYLSGKEIQGRPNFCPLVEIPTPHGRMIDADALFEAMGLDTVKEVMLRNWKFTTAWGVPIIEAEE